MNEAQATYIVDLLERLLYVMTEIRDKLPDSSVEVIDFSESITGELE